MDFSTLEEIKMGEINTKEESIQKMGELREQIDAYLQKNLDNLLKDEKGANIKEKIVETEKKFKSEFKKGLQKVEEKSQNGTWEKSDQKEPGKFQNFLAKSFQVAKNLLIKAYPLIKFAVKKVVFKI